MGEGRPGGRVLVVGGTHGNEVNAVWLLEDARRRGTEPVRGELAVHWQIGNPAAVAAGCRYLDRDLNRSFDPPLLADPRQQDRELQRARELLERHGPEGKEPCLVALDLHSTTAAMGNCLVVYGRRPTDLALAAALQGRLGLPLYLHEGDPRQRGYLAERWPCGLVVEVGPVPQGVVRAAICRQTRLALAAALDLLAEARRGALRLPPRLVVHLHRTSLDLPRQGDGSGAAAVHPLRQDRDWQPLQEGDPLFEAGDGSTIGFEPPPAMAAEPFWPVFINEAAYGEKGIALSLTSREEWSVAPAWGEALVELARGLEPRA